MPDSSTAALPLRRLEAFGCPWHPSEQVAWVEGALVCTADPSHRVEVRDGVWEALADQRPSRSPAQLTNIFPPTTYVYEAGWRVRSLGLLSHRPFPVREELAELEAAVGDVDGELVVDVACSEGLYGRRLAQRGADVVFVDHSRPFLRRARWRSDREGVGDQVIAMRSVAQRLPLRDGSCAAAVMGGSLNEIGDQRAAFAEMARVLRPGGRLFSMSLLRSTRPLGGVVQRLLGPSGIAFFSVAETRALLPATMRVVEERVDGIVLRLTAEKAG